MAKRIKEILLYLVLILISLSSLRNSIKQILILSEAKKENNLLSGQIAIFNREKHDLLEKIEYATSSAYINSEIRDKFGLGTKDDYWLKIPELNMEELHPKIEIVKNESNLVKWWKLFK